MAVRSRCLREWQRALRIEPRRFPPLEARRSGWSARWGRAGRAQAKVEVSQPSGTPAPPAQSLRPGKQRLPPRARPARERGARDRELHPQVHPGPRTARALDGWWPIAERSSRTFSPRELCARHASDSTRREAGSFDVRGRKNACHEASFCRSRGSGTRHSRPRWSSG